MVSFADFNSRGRHNWIARELREPGYLKNNIRDGVHPQGPAAVQITWSNMENYLSEVTSI